MVLNKRVIDTSNKSTEDRFIIYRATNKTNNKIYIGRTSQNINDRILGHKHQAKRDDKSYHFKNAINKYGIDGFYWEVIDRYSSRDEMIEAEIDWINKLDAINPSIGYNSITKDKVENKNINRQELSNKIRYNSHANSTKLSEGYFGVSRVRNNYYASIVFNGQLFKNFYRTPELAAEAYDKLNLLFYPENPVINFPNKRQSYGNEDLSLFLNDFMSRTKGNKSGIKGLYTIREGKYRISVNVNGKTKRWIFSDKDKAIEIYDILSVYLKKSLKKINNLQNIIKLPYDYKEEVINKYLTRRNRRNKNKYANVSLSERNGKKSFNSSIKILGKYFRKTFKSEDDAASYIDVIRVRYNKDLSMLNFPNRIDDYRAGIFDYLLENTSKSIPFRSVFRDGNYFGITVNINKIKRSWNFRNINEAVVVRDCISLYTGARKYTFNCYEHVNSFSKERIEEIALSYINKSYKHNPLSDMELNFNN